MIEPETAMRQLHNYKIKITDATIAPLRPRARVNTVWDSRSSRLGVRVRPMEYRGRTRRVSLRPATLKSIAEVRPKCHERRARAEPKREARGPEAPERTAPLFRNFVASA